MKNQSETQEIGLEDQNSLFKIIKNLKDSIFNVLFVLLDKSNEDQTMFGLCLEVGVDYLQMMAFPFNAAIITVWNGGQTLQSWLSVSTFLTVSQFLPSYSFAVFLIMVYTLILLIIIVIVDIIYVSYSFSKKKFTFTWPLVLLAQIVPPFVTVFFLPIMETLFAVVSCQASQDDPGVQVMQGYPDVICWRGWHLFHSAVTLLFSSIFVFISSIVALAMFEPRITSNKLTARQNSTGQVVFIINKIVCQFVFSFTPFENTWIYCIMLFSLSGWLYWTYNIKNPYYTTQASKFFRIVSTYYFWTNLMLMVSQILLMLDFGGSLVIWFCGLPFIALSIIFDKKSNINTLFKSNLKFRSGQEIEDHIKYVLKLLHFQETDKNSHMLLLGYIEKHKQICVEDDCPFKEKHNQQNIDENLQQLVKQLDRMYKSGLKKHPQCTQLRLSYAFFHMQKTKDTISAYKQFATAQKSQPSFVEEFIIYRFKKIIKQNLQKDDENQNADLIELIRFDNHVSLCQQAMVDSALLHKDFWIQLSQQIPNLAKLNSIGSKITHTIKQVKSNYEQIKKINGNVPEVIQNYALYLMLVEQNIKQGTKLLQSSKKIYLEKTCSNKHPIQQKIDCKDVDKNIFPMFIVESFPNTGRILQANKNFSELSGYARNEIINRSLEKLLPDLYEVHHNKIMREDAEEDHAFPQYINVHRESFIKQKSGFIIPVSYKVIVEPTNINNLIVIFQRKYQENCSYIITNPKHNIRQASASSYSLLNLNQHITIQGQNNNVSIEEIGLSEAEFSKLKKQRNCTLQITLGKKTIKGWVKIKYKLEKQQLYIRLTRKEKEKNISDSQQELVENLDGTKQKRFQNRQLLGYLYKITEKQQEKKANSLTEYFQHKEKNALQFSEQFYQVYQQYDDTYRILVQRSELTSKVQNRPISKQYGLRKRNALQLVNTKAFKQQKSNKEILYQQNIQRQAKRRQTIKIYSETLNIKTYRLKKNQQIERVRFFEEEDSQYDFQESIKNIQHKIDMKKLEFSFYREKIRKAIDKGFLHVQIKILIATSFLFLLCVIALMNGMEAYNRQQISQIPSYIDSFFNIHRQQAYLMKIIDNTFNSTSYTQSQQEIIYKFIANHKIQMNLPNLMTSYENMTSQIQSQLLHTTLILLNSHLSQIYNPYRIIPVNILRQKSYINMLSLIEELKIFHEDIVINIIGNYGFLISVIFLIIVLVGIWTYFILKLHKRQSEIILLFLDIPIQYVQYLSTQCNKYSKLYIPFKQLEEKGIVIDNKDHYFQSFQMKNQTEQNQTEQQHQMRKILIYRFRKRNLIDYFQCRMLRCIWIILLIIPIIITIMLLAQFLKYRFQLYQPQIIETGRHLLNLHKLTMGYNLNLTKGSFNEIKQPQNIIDQSLETFDNLFSKSVAQFNDIILDENGQSDILYKQVYFNSLCEVSINSQYLFSQAGPSNTNVYSCTQILNQVLQGGIKTFAKTLRSIKTDNNKIFKQYLYAEQNYVVPQLLMILQAVKQDFHFKVNTFITIHSIITYVVTILIIFGWIGPWLYYLHIINRKVNETIKMLNMVPLQYLVWRGRKQIGQFIDWILRGTDSADIEIQ